MGVPNIMNTLKGKHWCYSNDNNFIISCNDGTITTRHFKLLSDGTISAENVNIKGDIGANTISSSGITYNTSKKKYVTNIVQIEEGKLKVKSTYAGDSPYDTLAGQIYATPDGMIVDSVATASNKRGYFLNNWSASPPL